jgi:uncharacterized protein (DUF433 family)
MNTTNQRITLEPGKRGGKPCVRGLRITVQDVLNWLASGRSEADILGDYPELTAEDIHAVLSYAADRERHAAWIAVAA